MTGKQFIDSYLPLSDSLHKVAFYILEDSQDAEDTVQDLYVKLWQSKDSLDTVRNPKAYCIRLLKNMCIDRIRKKGPDARLEESSSVAEGSNAETTLETREKMSAVVRVMDRLSKSQKQVLQMRVFEDMSYEEISKETGMSNLTLRVLLSQARNKIKRAYEKD